ncbi:MAG: inorganic phosphate transporter [Dehalococcoidia bacterium]|jgi:PiT family inorganic phosphate transporter|nr:inorganic phosphate transporter [Dehalococcoidia bacterium]
MPESYVLLGLVVGAAIVFAFVNGANDAANSIATVIGTRNLAPRTALVMAAFCEFAGAASGTAVAVTIGKGIVNPEALTMGIILSGVGAIIVWAIVATLKGMPISLHHGLVSGLVGAALAQGGLSIINLRVLGRIFGAVVTWPVLGLTGGFALMLAILWLCRRWKPATVRTVFSRLQVCSAAFLAYSHGKNDGQMPIALIAMGLMAFGGGTTLDFPMWSVMLSAASISLGTAIGGRRVIRTMGSQLTTLKPENGFAAEASAATLIEIASRLGLPVSTTHCISSTIMGVGAARRLSAVRWGVAERIVLTWVLTFPGCGMLGFVLGLLLRSVA